MHCQPLYHEEHRGDEVDGMFSVDNGEGVADDGSSGDTHDEGAVDGGSETGDRYSSVKRIFGLKFFEV